MKRAIVACVLVAVAAYATAAWSAGSATTPTEKKLLKDVATLKKQVKTLQAAEKKLNTDTANAFGFTLGIAVCGNELVADALQGTWQVVDQVSSALQGGKTYFGPQTPVTATVSSQDICAGTRGITRSQVVPPSIAQIQALLSTFNGYRLHGFKLAGFKLK